MDILSIVLTILKGVGLVIAGIFGIVGARTNFKNADGTITVWGRRNLVALLFGLVLSLSAQAIEFARNRSEALSAGELAKRAADQAEALLKQPTESVERIKTVSSTVQEVSEQAKVAADKLDSVSGVVCRFSERSAKTAATLDTVGTNIKDLKSA
jgi:methyl-accepting chemotaxis protein